MYFIPALLFAFSANIDSLVIGLSYGIKKTRLSLAKTTLISLVTLCGTILALLLGQTIFSVFPGLSTQWLGNLLLIGLGYYYIRKSLRHILIHKKDAPTLQKQSSEGISKKSISTKACIFLGITLSLNNFGIGIGASISGLTLLPATALSFFISVLFLYIGNVLGRFCISTSKDWLADLISGIILIVLGIYGCTGILPPL